MEIGALRDRGGPEALRLFAAVVRASSGAEEALAETRAVGRA